MTTTIRYRAYRRHPPRDPRAYIEELLPDILEGRIEPGRVFDRTVDLDGYRAMADREAVKVMIKP